MNRREFLHRASASAAVAGFAGCVGSATLDSGSPGSDSADGDSPDGNFPGGESDDEECETPEKSSADDFSGVESEADGPFREITLGSRDGVAFPENDRPRTLRVWNAADATRTVHLRVAREGDRLFDEAVEFAPDAYLTATLAEPADYSVSVRVSGPNRGSCDSGADGSDGTTGGASAEAAAFPVPRSAFDCNYATIDVGVMPDGRIETLEETTMMECHGPRVAETSFSTERGNCGTEDRASVGFDRERVRVEGAVRTPTPQWSLELAAAEYDADADSLAVRVRATESETDEAGIQCVAEVPYEATVGFESSLPGEVVVVHEANGETTEAARVARSTAD